MGYIWYRFDIDLVYKLYSQGVGYEADKLENIGFSEEKNR